MTFFDEDQDELPVDRATFFKTYQKSLNALQFNKGTSLKEYQLRIRKEIPGINEAAMQERLQLLILQEERSPSSLEYIRALPSKTFYAS